MNNPGLGLGRSIHAAHGLVSPFPPLTGYSDQTLRLSLLRHRHQGFDKVISECFGDFSNGDIALVHIQAIA